MKADRSHPLLTHWLLSPAAPGPPLSIPSWLRRAGACRKEGGRCTVKISSDYPAAQPSVCLHPAEKYIRLESSIGAVDEVPVTDLLQNQQGARLMTLKARK